MHITRIDETVKIISSNPTPVLRDYKGQLQLSETEEVSTQKKVVTEKI